MTTFETEAAALARHLANEVAAGRMTPQEAGDAATGQVWAAIKAAKAEQRQSPPPADPGSQVEANIAAAFERRKEAQMLADLYELAAEEVAAANGLDAEQLFELALSDPAAAEDLLTRAGFSEATFEQADTNSIEANAEAAGVDVSTFTGQTEGSAS
jgi:hypothetical protein